MQVAELLDTDYPADPYPGCRPDCSFVHHDGGMAHRLVPRGPGDWRIGDQTLHDWLTVHAAPGPDERVPVLAYGSNACPPKITWLRDELGLTGPVVVLRCHTVGLAAVWCAHPRARDGQLPAVLAARPGRVETHAVWLASPEQQAVLDVCECRGECYELVHLSGDIEVRTEDGALVPQPLAYVATAPVRAPILRDGVFVPVSELDQAGAQRLRARGATAADHDACGLSASPAEWRCEA